MSSALQPLLRTIVSEISSDPGRYGQDTVRALALLAQEADRRLGTGGDLREVLASGSDLRPAEFSQPGWAADTVNNAERIFFTTVRVILNQPSAPATAGPPPALEGPEFRKAVATTLLNRLTYTQNEINWLDDRFVELTAVVEDVDGYPATGRRSLLRRRGRYATRPLIQVLADPETDLVLLQAAPGAGKSVALRQYARARLSDIRDGRTPDAPLPIYVNLRELKARPHEINTEVLRRYIAEQSAPRGSTELAAYFAHHFADDLRRRRVTLLLDSFDEIPAILGSATVDKVVSPYVQTVIELVGGGGRCIVASREYKGPRASGWTRLQILGLSPVQQGSFLHRAGLDKRRIELVQPLLTDPRLGFVVELQNPLSLSLLTEYIKARDALPDRPSALFEEYVARRLGPALESVGRPDDSAEQRRAEQQRIEGFLARFAFRLTSTLSALSVDEQSFLEEVEEEAAGDPHVRDRLIGVIADSRLLTRLPEHSGRRRIAFGHRRVQQYFASRYVAEHPAAVPPQELATHGKWRETAVTVLQVGSSEVTGPLLDELAGMLAAEWDRYREAESSSRAAPRKITGDHAWWTYDAMVSGDSAQVPSAHAPFRWSPTAVHCLELLVSAYHGRLEWPRASLEELIEALVDAAWHRGSISDQKFAVDCLPLLPQESRERYIDLAFSGTSNWVRATALRDCSTLPSLSPAINRSIRRLLITMLGEKSLAAESHAVDVDLQRLRRSDDLVRVRRVLSRTPGGLAVICLIHTLVAFFVNQSFWRALQSEVLWWWLPSFFVFWWFQSSKPLSYGSGKSRVRRFVERVAERGMGWRMHETDADTVLGLAVLVAGLGLALHVAWGIWRLTRGHVAEGIVVITVYAPLSTWVYLWAPSVLYLVYHGDSAGHLSPVRLILAVVDAVRIDDHPVRELSAADWLKHVLGTVQTVVLTMGPLLGLFYLLKQAGPTGRLISLIISACLAAFFPLIVLAGLVREIRSHRRVQRAVRRGRKGTSEFFENMFSLRDADEAAEYVRLVRGGLRLATTTLDQHAVRACINLLQNVSREREPAPHGVAPEGLRRLARWKGDRSLLDELGRLDEQLRAR